MRFCHFLQKHYGRMDGPTDGPMVTGPYRDARRHLKIKSVRIERSHNFEFRPSSAPISVRTFEFRLPKIISLGFANLTLRNAFAHTQKCDFQLIS